MKLFAIQVGGSHARALIELHDVMFVAADSLEEAIPELRRRWWGTPSSLHIDSVAEIEAVDGYAVTPVPTVEAEPSELKLYFVNVGGYTDGGFGELHHYSFHVAADKKTAWKAARAAAGFAERHQDNLEIVDDVVSVAEALGAVALRIEPSPAAFGKGPRVVAHYVKLRA